MQNPYKLFQKIISLSFFAIALFLIPSSVKAAGLLENCNGISVCGSDLTCDFPGVFNKLGNGTTKYCLPHKDYPKCDKATSKSCADRKDTRTVCGLVGSITTPSNYDISCLTPTDVPANDESKNECETSADCTTGTGRQQCVLVTAYEDRNFYEITNIEEFVSVKKCIEVEKLPAKVLDKESGSCGSNGVCKDTESCIENTYEPSSLQSYVCLPKTKVLIDDCSTLKAGDTCAFEGAETKGICMNVINKGKTLKCIDINTIPGGPNGPSSQTCKTDADCKSTTTSKYCLKNPITLKNNCFPQTSIFTTMGDPFKQFECSDKPCSCTLAGVKGCEPNGKESICAEHFDGTAGKAVCINFLENGAALGTGGAAPEENPEHAQVSVAEQTYKQYAPALEIDIPDLNFTPEIVAEDGPDGQKTYATPYMAQYINAVYKYGIGFGVLIAVVMMMFMGFRWMTSFGNQKAVSDAKEGLGNAVLGLLLLLSAYTILYVVNPDLIEMKALKLIAPKQIAFEDNLEEETTAEAMKESGEYPTGAQSECLLQHFAPGRKVGDKPETVQIDMFNLGRSVSVNKYSAPAWKKVSKEILELSKTDPEVKGILQYMYDFRDKKVPDLYGKKDGQGVMQAKIVCIGCTKSGKIAEKIGSNMHPIGLALDFMTRSTWAIKWGAKKSGTKYCDYYKKTLQDMKSGVHGDYLKSDPYKMFNRLTPLAESCVNGFNNGKWTIWPKSFTKVFTDNGFRAGENFRGLYSDAMHFEYLGPCMKK